MRNQNPKTLMATRTLAYSALMAALSVVLARLFGLMPDTSSRYSIEAVPIFMSGMLFGPLAGGMVGFTADLVGCLFSGYGYNPLFCLPPILYGVAAGLFRYKVAHKRLLWLIVSFVLAALVGSIGYQSWALAFTYYYDPAVEGSLQQGLIYFLSTRSVQFAVTAVIDISIIYLLLRLRIFNRMRLWPPKERRTEDDDC